VKRYVQFSSRGGTQTVTVRLVEGLLTSTYTVRASGRTVVEATKEAEKYALKALDGLREASQ
jgi:hypothetical protein